MRYMVLVICWRIKLCKLQGIPFNGCAQEFLLMSTHMTKIIDQEIDNLFFRQGHKWCVTTKCGSSLMRIESESFLMRPMNLTWIESKDTIQSGQKLDQLVSSWTSKTSANTFHNERCCSYSVIELGLTTLHLQTSLSHCHIVNIWTLVFGKFILDRIGV